MARRLLRVGLRRRRSIALVTCPAHGPAAASLAAAAFARRTAVVALASAPATRTAAAVALPTAVVVADAAAIAAAAVALPTAAVFADAAPLAAAALALAAAVVADAAALAASAVALAAVGGVAFADRIAALDRLLFRQRSGLSGRGGYDCIGRQVPAVEQPGPEHPPALRGGQPQLLPQP